MTLSGPFLRLGGRVVMQRPAKPWTPVRFRPQPPKLLPTARFCTVFICPGGEIGRRKGLKIPRELNPVPVRVFKYRLPDFCGSSRAPGIFNSHYFQMILYAY